MQRNLFLLFVISILSFGGCSKGVVTTGEQPPVTEEPACDDEIQNGDETGVDCGGSCSSCSTGLACVVAADCESGVCDDSVCVAPSCDDGILNGDETGIDCGGSCETCIACETDEDCGEQICVDDVCINAPNPCEDNLQNGLETDVDCGGPVCPACESGVECVYASDCESGICSDTVCIAATCSDERQNGDETGVDCGGSCADASPPQLCEIQSGCESGDDCESGVCLETECRPASCTDTVLNGYETAVDCGGSECLPCDSGAECTTSEDCDSLNCEANVCVAAACDDTIQNGDEIAVDCGGSCTACDPGTECSSNTDCASGICDQSICVDATCTDSQLNGSETDIDCGGECAPCDEEKECLLNIDCASGVCDSSTSTCSEPSCTDTVQNGDETHIDCGGSCPNCAGPVGCLSDWDCLSHICIDSICIAPACDDGVLNGDEADVDCGGSCLGCDIGGECELAIDCASGVCDTATSTCSVPTCTDTVQNGDETDTDCGGTCPKCGDSSDCVENTDCESNSCTLGVCEGASCTNGSKDTDETDTDCGGVCAPCDDTGACLVASDCQSGVCESDSCQAPSCTDSVHNGDETAIDCGGSCPDCAIDDACTSGEDCVSGLCVDSLCAETTCGDGIVSGTEECDDDNSDGTDNCKNDCTLPVCGDGYLSNNATGELAEVCDDGNTDLCAGSCNADCSATVSITGCGDGIICGSEMCDGSDTGDASCTNSGFASGTIACASTCDGFDFSSCTDGCGNGIIEGDEICDRDATHGLGCTDVDFDSGVLGACLSSCDGFDTSACIKCGNSRIDGDEVCDLQDLGGKTCQTENFEGGNLACNATCDALNTSGCSNCPATCPDGSTCIDGACECSSFMTMCSDECISTLTDPLNCGGCDQSCSDATYCSDGPCLCSAGVCIPTSEGCQLPLVACNDTCVDIQTDNYNCGACNIDCGGDVCIDGGCSSNIITVGAAPAECIDGGPPISLGTGDALDCSGDLAAVSFRWALCSCNDMDQTQPIFTDGFDSSTGPYRASCENGTSCQLHSECAGDGDEWCADEMGAGLGVNGYYDNNTSHETGIWGTFWVGLSSLVSNLTTRQDVHTGGYLDTAASHISGDAYVSGNLNGTGTIDGDLYTSSTSSISNLYTISGNTDASASPLVVSEPCDCDTDQLVDVTGIIATHACTGTSGECLAGDQNSNLAIGLDPDVFSGNGGRLELPCGHYYFSEIVNNGTALAIIAHGRVAIHIAGDLSVNKLVSLIPATNGELDIFVGGNVDTQQLDIGSPSYPSRTRMYVAGNVAWTQSSNIAANLYAPYGAFDITQATLIYGGLFVGDFTSTQSLNIHFDTAVVNAGDDCPGDCGNGQLDAPEVCDGTLFDGRTCLTEGFDGGTLYCDSKCGLDTSGCWGETSVTCGNGSIDTPEECDGSNFGDPATTCIDEGFAGGDLACYANCTLDTSGCYYCGDGVINTGESCDTTAMAGHTCVTQGFVCGTLACDSTCGFDTSNCFDDVNECGGCGNNTVEDPEVCDGSDLNGATCESLGFAGGTLGCSPTCGEYDTSGCIACLDCRDCNNQACNDGVCGECATTADCCAPLFCDFGTCVLF